MPRTLRLGRTYDSGPKALPLLVPCDRFPLATLTGPAGSTRYRLTPTRTGGLAESQNRC